MHRADGGRRGSRSGPADEKRVRARQGWAYIRSSMTGHWSVLTGSTVAALVSVAAIAVIPLVLGGAINDGLLAHHWTRFGVYAALIAVLGVIQAVGSGVRRRYNGIASREVESEMRRSFHDHLLGLDVSYHGDVNRGQLLSRVTSDLFQIQAVVVSAPLWVANAALAVAVAVILISENLLLGVVAMATLPVVVLTSKRFSHDVRSALTDLQRQRGALAGVVEETLSGIRAVKGLGAEPVMAARLAAHADGVQKEAMEVVATRARYLPVLNVIPMLELVAVNWLGGYLVLHHRLSVGLLVAFNTYLVTLTAPMQSIGAYIVMIQRAVVSGYRLDTIMRRKSLIAEPLHPIPLPDGLGQVSFEDVNFAYPGTAEVVLEGFALDIEGGESVALVGATGSGKTTVLSLLAHLYDPQSGSIRLDGVDVDQISLTELRSAVAIVFEDSFLFDDTISANLRVGRSDATQADLERAAKLAAAHEFISELPLGYETPVGERGFSLSGGQRQRIALARALLAEPRVLVLDDATSAVDAAREVDIVESLIEAREGRTTIIISHRPATIAVADRVVLIDAGKAVASGLHGELAAESARYRRVLALEGQCAS